jgi:hypothetical protein
MRTIIEGNTISFAEEVAGALADKVNYAVEITANGKIQLANAGIAIGTIREQMTPGDAMRPVALFGKVGVSKAIQSGAIAVGSRVVIDTANPGKVKLLPVAAGTYRSVGIKHALPESGAAAGAAGDVIEIIDLVETIIVT